MEVSCGKQEKSGNDATRDKARANSGRAQGGTGCQSHESGESDPRQVPSGDPAQRADSNDPIQGPGRLR